MAHPLTHAESSARRFGGVPEDYLPIHDLMDSSKSSFPDNRHRALTHNSWFIFIVERVFGHSIELTCKDCKGNPYPVEDGLELLDHPCDACEGKGVKGTAKVRYVCEQHILEDFGGKFIPTASDYLEGLEFQPWMNNGISGAPTSHRKLERAEPKTTRKAFTLD
jgi:hypothetical protein